MSRLFGSLLFRTAGLYLLGLFAMQGLLLGLLFWPDDRPTMFRLVDPEDAREIAGAIELAPQNLRPRIASAASNGSTTVELFPSLSAANHAGGRTRSAPKLDSRFAPYAHELEGRRVWIQVRDDVLFSGSAGKNRPHRGPIRVLIQLRTGDILSVERAPLLLRSISGRYPLILLAAGLVLTSVLLLLLRQIVRPIGRLSAATRAFQDDISAPDATIAGAREVRELAESFNDMKRRISGLVAERTHMLAAIAHDLRTYLTRLRLRAEYIGEDRQKDRAIKDVEEMSRLLEDILIYARAEVGPRDDTVVVDAKREAERFIDALETGRAPTLTTDQEEALCRCSPVAFRRILGNLVDNALKFGTQVDVQIVCHSSQLFVTVTDDGPGVPDTALGRLTSPFERVESSRARHTGGAGLGLSIVKALVETHDGTLSLENRQSGGFSATISLPLV